MLQSEELNAYGGLYLKRHPQLNIKIVDGTNLAVAVVLNNIPIGTTQVLLRGKISKVASAIALALCQKGIQVIIFFNLVFCFCFVYLFFLIKGYKYYYTNLNFQF